MNTSTKYRSVEELPISLNADDVSVILGLSRGGAYNLIHSEGFPQIKVGKRYIIPKAKFLEWIDTNIGGEIITYQKELSS